MASPAERSALSLKITLLALAATLNAMEFFIPRIPLAPWLKPGLANAVTIVWLVRFGPIDALLLLFSRIWVTGFYFGFSFFTVGVALAGGVASLSVMALLWETAGRRRLLGTIGLAIAGAAAHNGGQLLAVSFLLDGNRFLLYQVPLMLAASLLFGTIVGLLVCPLLQAVSTDHPATTRPVPVPEAGDALPLRSFFGGFLFLAGMGIAAVDDLRLLGVLAAAASLSAWAVSRRFLALFRPFAVFWLLYLFTAAMHLFFSYGTRIPGWGVVTREGVDQALVQWLRLTAWLQLTPLLRALELNRLITLLWGRLLPSRLETASAALWTMEYFPRIVGGIRGTKGESIGALLRSPRLALDRMILRVRELLSGSA